MPGAARGVLDGFVTKMNGRVFTPRGLRKNRERLCFQEDFTA